MNFCKKSPFTAVLFLLVFGFCSAPSSIYAQVQEITGSVSIQGSVDIEADPGQLDRTYPLGRGTINSNNIISTPESQLIFDDLGAEEFSRDSDYFNNHTLDSNGYHLSYFNWSPGGGTSDYKDVQAFHFSQENTSNTSYKPEVGNREDLTNSSWWRFSISIPTFNWNYFKADCVKAIFGNDTFFSTVRTYLKRPRVLDPLNFHYNIDAFNQGHIFQYSGRLLSQGTAPYSNFSDIWSFFKTTMNVLVIIFLYFFTFKVITCF